MSHRQKLEQVLDLLINEEHDAASELLHSVIVEKARQMYEELVDEDFGGDEKEDFAGEIEADKEEIESDEIFDGAEEEGENVEDSEESEETEDAPEGEIEDRVEDLEAALAELTAEFEQLVGGEEGAVELGDEDFADDSAEFGGEEGFGDEAGFGGDVEEVGAEEGMYEESVEDEITEATKLQDEVASPGMEKEGKLAGTGKHSKAGTVNTTSMFTKAPSKADHGGKPHKVGGKDEAGYKAPGAKDHTPEDNIAVAQKKVSTSVEGEGKFAGTGKGSKGGAVNTTSTLGSGKGPKGN